MLPEISLLFELLVAGMLAVMIYYAWRLNEKLSNLQNDKAELERLLANFGESTERAEASVQRLKGNAAETVQVLEDKVVKAVTLRDELAFMIERANDMADRLEETISSGRPAEGDSGMVARVREQLPSAQDDEIGDDGERRRKKTDLLKALEGMR
ncbi:MAG: hypothetical protein CMM28_04500 [Rhodospirillaceae bacterium]|nr:hypothetical protein [Rhodospirillaceae bacterium]